MKPINWVLLILRNIYPTSFPTRSLSQIYQPLAWAAWLGAELVNEFKEAGVHTINFNALELNSGLYIYKIEANGFVQSKKMMLVK